MCLIFTLLVLISMAYQVIICDQGQIRSEVRFTKAGNCNITGLTWILQNVTISSLYPASYISGTLNVTENTKKIKKVVVHLDRCTEQGFNCEDFQNWYFDNFCTMLTWKNQLWSSFVDPLQPPLRCPVKKMIYQNRNTTFDLDVASRWYPDFYKYEWKTTVKIFNEQDKLVFCAECTAHVYQYRIRNRKPHS